MTEPPVQTSDGVIVRWRSVADRTYTVKRSDDLSAEPRFYHLATGIQGINGISEYMDKTAEGSGPFCYQVEVKKE